MKTIKILTILFMPIVLSGCFENRNNTDKLCSDNPGLQCERLNVDDGQCRLPRTDLIWLRFDVLKNPTVNNKIAEYDHTRLYRRCLELASQIQTIDQTELKQNRVNALLNASDDMERLVNEIRQYHTPEALYFLWSQQGDHKARQAFLQLEGTPGVESPEMQYALATLYITKDPAKTIKLLNHALELSPADKINSEILKSLASSYQAQGDKEHAYLWAMVGKNYNVPVASKIELTLLYGFDDEKFKRLDELASTVIEAIEKGQFKPDMIPGSLK